MSRSFSVESVEVGDRVELWIGDSAKAVVVQEIVESESARTLHVASNGEPAEVTIPRSHEVNLVC